MGKKRTKGKKGGTCFRSPQRKTNTPTPMGVAGQEKQLVFVGVPVMGGSVGMGVVTFLRALDILTMNPQCPFAFIWECVNDRRPVEYARNTLLRSFLTKPELKSAIGIWFVDNDMIPPSNALEMLHVDGDIVAGMALAFDHPGKNRPVAGMKVCLFHHNPNNHRFDAIKPQYGQSVIDIDAAGTATMFIRRRVLEDKRMWLDPKYMGLEGVERDYSDETDEDKWAPPIFRTLYKPGGEILRGEDLDFSWRAKQLGYAVKGHLGCRWGHVKHVNLDDVLTMLNDTVTKIVDSYGGKNADQSESEGPPPSQAAVAGAS